MPFVPQEHEVLHSELNIQNKALLERVKELIDAGDEKDNRIRELEAQVRNTKGNLCSKSLSEVLILSTSGISYDFHL